MSTSTQEPPPASTAETMKHLLDKADANFIWGRLTERLRNLVTQKYAKTPEERPHYTPIDRPYANMSLLSKRVISSEFTWPMPESGQPLNSGELGDAMREVFSELNSESTYVWGDGCHPQFEFKVLERVGVIAFHGIPEGANYRLAMTMFVDKTAEEARRPAC